MRLENADDSFDVGTIAEAFRNWDRQVRGPRRYLNRGSSSCPCCYRPDRLTIEEALRRLPKRQARELRRLVEPIDERFLDRTFPDPTAPPGPWWTRRC